MAITNLQIDTATVRSLSENMELVHTELADGQVLGDAVASIVGHPALAQAVKDFTDGWDDRRRELTEQIGTLQSNAMSIADAFDSVDFELATAISGSGS